MCWCNYRNIRYLEVPMTALSANDKIAEARARPRRDGCR